MRNGIPTKYRGTQFRSRLEARWACYFDLLRWQWEYEPFDMDGYIPDFLILGKRPLLVEIKPVVSWIEAQTVAEGLPKHPDYEQLVLGISPSLVGEVGFGGYTAGGCLVEKGYADPDDLTKEVDWPQAAVFVWCAQCVQYGVVPDYGWYCYRPCGHSDGGHPNLTPAYYLPDWSEAQNATQWTPSGNGVA